MDVLLAAWHAIRRNAETSRTQSTREKARKFAEDLPRNLKRIQDRLREGYQFDPAYGALPDKDKTKRTKRPLVVAPLQDRIVQRAILDVLQDADELPNVRAVLATQTSIGGIRGRGVDHAVKLFTHAVEEGHKFVAGSDISGFFTKIPKNQVYDFLEKDGIEPGLLELIKRALTVELSNASQLREQDLELFPTGADGVAQGNPLSALAGNIVLYEFDREMNSRGIQCIRYIDDFMVTGKKASAVQKAMEGAKNWLSDLGMEIYDPATSPNKAFSGTIDEGHEFLGYQLIPAQFPPSTKGQKKLFDRINELISDGQKTIQKALSDRKLYASDRAYAQTLVAIDNTLKGWRGSYKSSDCPEIFAEIDRKIDRRLSDFLDFYRQAISGKPQNKVRRAMGVTPLEDMKQ